MWATIVDHVITLVESACRAQPNVNCPTAENNSVLEVLTLQHSITQLPLCWWQKKAIFTPPQEQEICNMVVAITPTEIQCNRGGQNMNISAIEHETTSLKQLERIVTE